MSDPFISLGEKVVRKAEQTPAVCSRCNESFQRVHGAVCIQVVWKDLKGKWQQARYCKPCAVWMGELQEARVEAALRIAEVAGV